MAAGVVVRQPIQDGEAAAYDILLADGRRVMLNEDSDNYAPQQLRTRGPLLACPVVAAARRRPETGAVRAASP